MKNNVQINRGRHKGHFWSHFHDSSTTMVSFSNSPSADARHSRQTQITGQPPVVLVVAHWNGTRDSDIKKLCSKRNAKCSACENNGSMQHLVWVSAKVPTFYIHEHGRFHTQCLFETKRMSDLPTLLIHLLLIVTRPTSHCWTEQWNRGHLVSRKPKPTQYWDRILWIVFIWEGFFAVW